MDRIWATEFCKYICVCGVSGLQQTSEADDMKSCQTPSARLPAEQPLLPGGLRAHSSGSLPTGDYTYMTITMSNLGLPSYM